MRSKAFFSIISASYNGKLLLYDGMEGSFRTIKLRNKKETCSVCGANPSITALQDYEQFCGSKASDKVKDCIKKESIFVVVLM